MPYQYDYFFSYKRHPQSDAWHRTVKDKLDSLLSLELARPTLSGFFDTQEISTGLNVREKLAESAKKSKCIVCIWSPLYFQSTRTLAAELQLRAIAAGFGKDTWLMRSDDEYFDDKRALLAAPTKTK
jgi:hypothetical protein